MTAGPYNASVEQLLRLGEPDLSATAGALEQPPMDYLALGLSAADVPDLIRLATDTQLRDSEQTPGLWGPVHAWWALGQLRAEAATQPLLDLLDSRERADDEPGLEDIPVVLGLIGSAAIEPAGRLLMDPAPGEYARAAAAEALLEIAKRFPEQRLACIEQLRRALEAGESNAPQLNAFIVSDLVDLQAIEAAGTIEQAYARDRIESGVVGDWDYVRPQLSGQRPAVGHADSLTESVRRMMASLGMVQGPPPTSDPLTERRRAKHKRQARKKRHGKH